MTQSEIQIEVISELTGDSVELVREVVLLLMKFAPKNIKDMMILQVADKDAEKIRNHWQSDNELIAWYKEGLHHLTKLDDRHNTVQ